MAIDTAEKRKSAAGIPFLPLGVGVTPNASKDQEWRQQAAWGYSGITAQLIVATIVGRWAGVIDLYTSNARIDLLTANSRLDLTTSNERLEL